MLTSEANRDRRWAWLPALRLALEDKQVSSAEPLTSIDESLAERFSQLIEIATLARGHKDAVREASRQAGATQVNHDVEHLEHALLGAANLFEDAARGMHQLHNIVERAGRELQTLNLVAAREDASYRLEHPVITMTASPVLRISVSYGKLQRNILPL